MDHLCSGSKRAVSDGYFKIFSRGIAAPIVIARPLDIRKYLYNSAKKGDLCRFKIADLSLVVYTHHLCANTDIVNLAIIDGLTKNLCRKKLPSFLFMMCTSAS